MKPKTMFKLLHPIEANWAKKRNLELRYDNLEKVIFAGSKEYSDKKFLFDENAHQEIERLNKIYGLNLDLRVLYKKTIGDVQKTLIELSKNQLEVYNLKIKQDKDPDEWDKKIFIGGISLPGKGFFYIESASVEDGYVYKNITWLPIK